MAYKVNGNVIIDNSGNAAFTNFAPVGTPRNISPAEGETDVGPTNITLTLSDFEALYSGTIPLKYIQVQVANVNTFAAANIVYDSGNAAASFSNTISVLTANTVFYWRGRYINNNDVYTDFSNATSFTSGLVPTVLGESFGGGYYAGVVDIGGGTCYYLILSPNSSGCAQCPWGEYAICQSSLSSVDGYCMTYVSPTLTKATLPAPNFTATRTIGGFSDWYIPARTELVTIYQNKGSLPAGEGFPNEIYWTALEANCNENDRVYMGDGQLGQTSKQFSCRVRAVRRIPK